MVVTRAWEYGNKTHPHNMYFNTLELQKELPQSYEITIEWEAAFKRSGNAWQQLVLFVPWGSKGNYVKVLDTHYIDDIRGDFTKHLGGKTNTVHSPRYASISPDPVKVRYRLRKVKRTLTAFVQRTGTDWIEVGKHKILKMKGAKLRVLQYNDGGVAEVEVHLKKVTIKELE